MMIAAFDLGVRNFAFAVKNKDEFILLKNTTLNDNIMTKTDLNKYKKKDLIEMLEDLHITIQEKLNKNDIINHIITHTKKSNKKVDLGLAMFETMDMYKDFWNKCDTFLIERQLMSNLQALKLSHYLEAYLKIYYPSKQVINYNASNKTKKLGGSHLKTKKERKKWTIDYALQLLTGDNLRCFKNLDKQDDVADAICMIEAYIKV